MDDLLNWNNILEKCYCLGEVSIYAIKRNLKIYVYTCVMADQMYAEGNGASFDFIRM